jgi:hypothetical protein
MRISRRSVLLAAAALPTVVFVDRAVRSIGDAARGAVLALRPAPDGTSATRCAQCGAPDHTMLDPACPLAPRVLS